MRLFLKRSRGSITVFVALILVPTVFFSGFLVDLARLKLYGNQAVMTADNYGEAVLTQYDNLLKELYGLFAVTQDTDGVKALDELQKYMQSSFDPSEKTSSWGHLQPVLGQTEYTGFMPYKDAEISFEREFVKESNLRTPEVLSTQIGDFMQFRIVQQLLGDDGSDLLEMVETIQNTESDAKIVDKKIELDKEAEKLYELAGDYYRILKNFTGYPDYIRRINDAYSDCKTQFSEIKDSSQYKAYHDYLASDPAAMEAAVKKRERIESGGNGGSLDDTEENGENTEIETLSEDEKNALNIHDAYMRDGEARRDALEKKFSDAIALITSARDSGTVRFDNYYDRLTELKQKSDEIVRKGDDLSKLRKELEDLLKEENVSEALKKGIEDELDELDDLFGQLGAYKEIADLLAGQDASVNEAYRGQTEQIISRLNEIKGRYLDGDIDNLPDWEKTLDQNKWVDFKPIGNFLYNSLAECFEPGGEGSDETKKKDKANQMLTQAEDEMSKEEKTSARDVPESFHYGTSIYSSSFKLTDMVDDAVGMFSANHFENEMNRLLLKLYTVEYDFGMFSSRITNVGDDKSGQDQKEESLTGYEKAANINYLYQAELEYILGGSNSSKENLNGARNKILAFRAIVNFTATYQVDEVNNAIKTISNLVPYPALGLVVNAALRLAVAGIETAADWEELKKGESVFLIKKQLKELSAYDTVKELIGDELQDKGGKGEGESKAFQMDYGQYLMVMMIFFTSSEEVAQRTADLIELNVNTVRQGIGSSGELDKLEFQMSGAYTAVNATCKVHLDFVVMPQGFARKMTDDYAELEEFQKNSYQFTVTRGY